MSRGSAALTFHVICHTHWDREWYLPRAAFLPRLVSALGAVLDLLERDQAARFVLDGQTVLVDDVLALHSEWAARVAAVTIPGRLELGPWYILADELIPTGESLVRNLLLGARDAGQLGARMPVLYSPDAFGHPAILPTLAMEFGLNAAVTWRGARGPSADRDLDVWRGPDGAAVLLHRLPKQGYEIGMDLAGQTDDASRHWRVIRPALVDRAVTPHIAVFVGADHHAPPRNPGGIRDLIQALEPGHRVRLSTLREYFEAAAKASEAEALRARVETGSDSRVDGVSGELRWSDGHPWILQGVHGTRARLKRHHTAAELLIARKAEVLVALAVRHAGIDQRAILRTAWQELLQCQFHDTLCGCCCDRVAREQESRLADVAAMGRELVRSSLHALSRHDADAARQDPAQAVPTLLLWNPVPRGRRGVVIAELTFFRRDILVGPPSGRRARAGGGFQPFVLVDHTGTSIPVQVLSVTPGTERIDAARHYPDQDAVDRVLVAFESPAIAGLGLIGLVPSIAGGSPGPSGVDAVAGRIGNRFIEVHAGEDGRIDLVDRRNGERYADVAHLVDECDLGDSYTPWSPPGSPVAGSITVDRQSLLASGPLVAAIETRFSMASAGRGRISGRRVLIVHADSPVLRVRIELENGAWDHRLRLRLPVGAGDAALAGAAFGFEWREAVSHPDDAFPAEIPARTAPAQRYVAAGSSDRGLVLLCPGFFEYEWTAARDLVLTVLRATGELSRDSLPTRPSHAGWPMAIPDAQEPGRHDVEFAVAPLGAPEETEIAALERLWEDTFLAPQPTFVRDFAGSLELSAGIGITLKGDGLIFTSLKPAEAGPGLVLRCYNSEPARVAGRWLVPAGVGSAHLLRADETVIEPLTLAEADIINFVAPPRGIVTILVTPSAR